jgi:hypothetical protein
VATAKEPKTFDEKDIKGDASVPKSDDKTYRNFQPVEQKEWPKKMVIKEVKFPDKTVGYDMNTLVYCCPEMRHAVMIDGSSVALYPQGLVLRRVDMRNAMPLKQCMYCGKEIIHEAL